MKTFAIVLAVAAAVICTAGDAVCDDIYYEGWNGGTTAGWQPSSAASEVVAGDDGGNPDGYLGIQGASDNSELIGAMTTSAEATGDYAAAGVGIISFDVRFVSGYYVYAWLRLRSGQGSTGGWLCSARVSKEPGETWRTAMIGIDTNWDDVEARNAGWIREPGAPDFQDAITDVYAVEVVFMAFEMVDVRIDNFRLSPAPPCPENLPDPVLVFNGKRVAGDFLIKWEFSIENWQDYPPEMFLLAPELGPCGPNPGAPRTSHAFYRAGGRGLANFCGVTKPSELQDLFFTAGNIGTPDVYVELYDRKCDKIYRSNTVSTVYVNEPPIVSVGPDRTVECAGPTTPVTLDGSASYDPEGSPITFEWSAQGVEIDDLTSPVTVGHFPLGTYQVVLKVRDELNLATGVVEIKVVDTSPPDLRVELNRSIVWPPNHKYFDIHADVTADDACGDLASVVLMGIYDSNSPDPSVSVHDAQFGTLDTDFRLLAEREGNEPGRNYAIVYMALDNALNLAMDTVVVRVPHDRSGHARASIGFGSGGRSLSAASAQFALVVPSISGRGSNIGFDAMTIDVGAAQIGNNRGAVSPSSAYRGDTDGDGLEDLVLFYATADAVRLLELSGDGDEGLSFYYGVRAGDVFTVEDIFDLGKPVSIPLSGLEPVRGYGYAGGPRDPHLQLMLAAPAPQTSLGQAYPNPFNPSTTIPFELAARENVTLRVYDARGRLVRTLENKGMPAGRHQVIWNGRDNSGRSVATGVYFVRMTAGSREMTRKLVLIK